MTGRSKIFSVICHVHRGARSREGLARRPLLSIPRSQERTVERHLDVHCASVSRFERVAIPARNNLELARSIEQRDSSPTCQFVSVCEGIS